MTFLRVVGKRLFWAAVLLVLVLCLNFFLIRLAPGDPAVTIAGEMGGASPELLASIREQYGLNQSLFNQFVAYFGKVLHGDLGYSYFFNLPVMELIQDRLPATLLLVVTAVCAAVLIGVCLGVQAGRRPNSWTSHLVTIVALIGCSAPAFWTGMMLLILFASWIPILPVSGMTTIGAGYTGFAYVLDVAHHLILPVVTLAILYIAQYSRMERASMIDILGTDYIRTARAKGLRATDGRVQARLEERAHPGGDAGGYAIQPGVRRGRARGNGIQLARHGAARLRVHPAQGLSHAARHPLLLRVRGHHRQRPDRLRLPVS